MKVRLSQDICGFSLQTLRQQSDKRKGYKLGTLKGTKGEANVRLCQDICGLNVQTLRQQSGKGKSTKLGEGGSDYVGSAGKGLNVK
jgi:hypothetical protein